MTFTAPAGSLGADLFWWRETGSVHTLVTISRRAFDWLLDGTVLRCVLFDETGEARASWDIPMTDRAFCAIDSARMDDWLAGAPQVASGVLAIYTMATVRADAPTGEEYMRLYSMVEWYSDDWGTAGLHNDQSIVRGAQASIGLTETSVIETGGERSSLVFVNGETPQPPGAVTVTVTNSGGASRTATYDVPMAPFTVHQVRLARLFTKLHAFGAGGPLDVSGTCAARGIYLRPYVITEGERFAAYHGGDIYHWPALPAFHYRLLGGGEVNPIAVIHRPGEVESFVNLFNSQGSLEESFWVDADLFDESGACVARRERWQCARRNAVVRAGIAGLLADPSQPFTGHIALRFSPSDAESYPRRLQALLEYRTPGGATHVMTWSDEWNSLIKLHKRKREGALPMLSYYRAWCGRGLSTYVSLSNAGHGGYRETAPCVIRLVNTAGESREVARDLGPYATLFANIDDLFPGAAAFLGPGAVGMLEVESTFDLANVQFVRHDATGAWDAEHYMAAITREGERIAQPAGA